MRYANTEFQVRSIPLSQLKLWSKNPRFPKRYLDKLEKEQIAYFCNQVDYNILSFAEKIVTDFDLPQLEKLVVYQENEQFFVLEGNRRVTVYKLLFNPSLAPSQDLVNYFLKLQQNIDLEDDILLECVITKNLVEGSRYVDRKHLYGNNEVGWQDQERAVYKTRKGIASEIDNLKVKIQEDIIEELDIPETMKSDVLGKGHVTTFWRILLEDPGKKYFGFKISKKGDLQVESTDFTKKLKVIIANVLNKEDFNGEKVNSRRWNDASLRKQYLDSITEEHYEKANLYIKQEKSKISDKAYEANKPKLKMKEGTFERGYLIPPKFRLEINNSRINDIFKELKDRLPLEGAKRLSAKKSVPNAVSVLFRVFLEVSLDFFWEQKVGKIFAKKIGISEKIRKVAEYMESEGMASEKQLVNIRMVAGNKKNIVSIENFHRYVHSFIAAPLQSDLKTQWNNLQEFFKILWVSLSTQN